MGATSFRNVASLGGEGSLLPHPAHTTKPTRPRGNKSKAPRIMLISHSLPCFDDLLKVPRAARRRVASRDRSVELALLISRCVLADRAACQHRCPRTGRVRLPSTNFAKANGLTRHAIDRKA